MSQGVRDGVSNRDFWGHSVTWRVSVGPRQGLFIFTLSVAEGSKVLACIPFFILEPSPCRVILDSSPSAQNDISR